jgi:transposase InsO family protein
MGHVQSPPTSLISEEATVSPNLAQWVLNENWFIDIDEVVEKANEWRTEFNEVRPHTSLRYMTPNEYAASFKQAGLSD